MLSGGQGLFTPQASRRRQPRRCAIGRDESWAANHSTQILSRIEINVAHTNTKEETARRSTNNRPGNDGVPGAEVRSFELAICQPPTSRHLDDDIPSAGDRATERDTTRSGSAHHCRSFYLVLDSAVSRAPRARRFSERIDDDCVDRRCPTRSRRDRLALQKDKCRKRHRNNKNPGSSPSNWQLGTPDSGYSNRRSRGSAVHVHPLVREIVNIARRKRAVGRAQTPRGLSQGEVLDHTDPKCPEICPDCCARCNNRDIFRGLGASGDSGGC